MPSMALALVFIESESSLFSVSVMKQVAKKQLERISILDFKKPKARLRMAAEQLG